MNILGYKPQHDGSIAVIDDGRLLLSYEAEKGGRPRHAQVSADDVLQVLTTLPMPPDVLALGGWYDTLPGYDGVEPGIVRQSTLLGRPTTFYSSSHERSHILCAYATSPFPQGQPCYTLVWEGWFGRFYAIDGTVNVTPFSSVLDAPGFRYAYAYFLAERSGRTVFRGDLDLAGKLMALAAHSSRTAPSTSERREISRILDCSLTRSAEGYVTLHKTEDCDSPYCDVGLENEGFREFAGKLSDAIFDRFHAFAAQHLKDDRRPLLISGGCGLNCEWNTRWAECGLFDGVFVPPFPNDAGSAIGSAADAQFAVTGNAKISWDVYSGQSFRYDRPWPDDFVCMDASAEQVADLLANGKVLAWVEGRCEIGPRALGHRSLLAAPFDAAMRDRLNRIKERESFRPIAPLCREEAVTEDFHWTGPSPYMLYFQRVRSPHLRAVTHVDGTARVQTVTAHKFPRLHELLTQFQRRTGTGVLCNTSLNYRGQGFINSASQLVEYMHDRGVDCAVVENSLLIIPSR